MLQLTEGQRLLLERVDACEIPAGAGACVPCLREVEGVVGLLTLQKSGPRALFNSVLGLGKASLRTERECARKISAVCFLPGRSGKFSTERIQKRNIGKPPERRT